MAWSAKGADWGKLMQAFTHDDGSAATAAVGDLYRLLRGLVPTDALIEVATIAGQPEPLQPSEEVAVRDAVPSRRAEFAFGRQCARRALRRLGLGDVAIPVGPRREPRWPDGVIGSISHAGGHCAAVVARGGLLVGIGIDIEVATPLQPSLRRYVLTEAEQAGLDPSQPLLAKVAFSAKESVFKAIHGSVRRYVDMHEVEVHFDGADGFAIQSATVGDLRPAGRWAANDRFVATCATLAITPKTS